MYVYYIILEHVIEHVPTYTVQYSTYCIYILTYCTVCTYLYLVQYCIVRVHTVFKAELEVNFVFLLFTQYVLTVV